MYSTTSENSAVSVTWVLPTTTFDSQVVAPPSTSLRGEVRDVDVQVAVPEVARHPADALEVDDHLGEPGLRRRVHRGERQGADHAVVVQAVVALEGLDRLLERGVEARPDGLGVRHDVAEARQPGAELGDARAAVAGMERRAVGDRGAPVLGPGERLEPRLLGDKPRIVRARRREVGEHGVERARAEPRHQRRGRRPIGMAGDVLVDRRGLEDARAEVAGEAEIGAGGRRPRARRPRRRPALPKSAANAAGS